MAYDLNAMMAQVGAKGKDMTQATAGGGDYTPPPEGTALARFVGYYELGKHEFKYQNQTKTQDEAELVFELHGKNYPPSEDGVPQRITFKTSVSLNEKSWMFKTFSAMNWEGKAKHIVQLLGNDYLLDIEHNKRGEGAEQRTYANVKKGSIRKPFFQQMDGEGAITEVRASVPGAKTPLKMFVWDFATPEMWDSVFIEGEYPERKDEKTGKVTRAAQSKNVIQNKIKAAKNYKGLAVYEYAEGKVTKTEQGDLDAALNNAGAPVVEDALVNPEDPMASVP